MKIIDLKGTPKQYSSAYYERHKEQWRKYAKDRIKKDWPSQRPEYAVKSIATRRKKRAKMLRNYKNNLSCCICHFSNAVALDFHHLDPTQKLERVTKLVGKARSVDIIKAEIDKCKVLCANCHRKEHASSKTQTEPNPNRKKEFQRLIRLKRLAVVNNIKQKLGCKFCPENDPVCLDFHHRDPSTKLDLVSRMVWCALAEKRILAEIEKCDVVCANCHRSHHEKEITEVA